MQAQWDAVLFDFEDTLVDLSRGGTRRGTTYFNGAPGVPPVRDAEGRPVMEAMLRLLEAGVPVAVVTSSPEAAMGRWFQEKQFCLSRPMTVVGFHDTVLHRPSPHPILEALHQLGLPPSRRILSVGDSASDIEAARRAGVTSATVRPQTPLGMPADIYLPTIESFFDARLGFALAGDLESDRSKTSLVLVQGEHEVRVGGRIRHRPSNRLTQLIDWTREGRWDEALVDLAETLVAHALGAQRENVLLTAVPPHRGQDDRLSPLMARLRTRTGLNASPLLRFMQDPGRQAARDRRERSTAMDGCLVAREKHDLTGQTVVVLDDVRSSGATLREAARALMAGGAARVLGIALAQEENRQADDALFGPLSALSQPVATADVAPAMAAVSTTDVPTTAQEDAESTPRADGDAMPEHGDGGEAVRPRVHGRVRVLGLAVPRDEGPARNASDPDGSTAAAGTDAESEPRGRLPAGFARPAGVFAGAPVDAGSPGAARDEIEIEIAAPRDVQADAVDADVSPHATELQLADVSSHAAEPPFDDVSPRTDADVACGDASSCAVDAAPVDETPVPTPPVRAYQRWVPEEDERLRVLHREGRDPVHIAQQLGRQLSSVETRIRRLALDFVEDEDGAAGAVQDEPVVAPPTDETPSSRAPAVIVDAGSSDEASTSADIRARYPRAYQRWLPDEDARLRVLHAEGASIERLVAALGRQASSIETRIRRLALDFVEHDEAESAQPAVAGADTSSAARVGDDGGPSDSRTNAAEDRGAGDVRAAGTATATPIAGTDPPRPTDAVDPEPTTPDAIKARYPRAYQRWEAHEDTRLRALHAEGLPLHVLADTLGRQRSAVDSRIRRLGLERVAEDEAAS